MNDEGCAFSKGEYLYILELFVEHVSLYAEKFDKMDLSNTGIDIHFIDFPLFRILHADFLYTKLDKMTDAVRDDMYRTIYFDAGKIQLFPYNPPTLIKKMREMPVTLDVYRVKGVVFCPEDVDKEPLGATQFPLAGCLCDQMTMAGNDCRHLPRTYVLDNRFNLVSKDYQPVGVIGLSVKLTCFGDFIGLRFAYIDKMLVFKNIDIASVRSYDHEAPEPEMIPLDEFECMKVPLFDEEERKADERERKICLPHLEFDEVSELDLPPKPQHVIGLVSLCNKLMETDDLPQSVPNELKKQKDASVDLPLEPEVKKPCLCSPYEALFKLNDIPPVDAPCGGGLCIGSKLLYVVPKNYEYIGDKLQSCPRHCVRCSPHWKYPSKKTESTEKRPSSKTESTGKPPSSKTESTEKLPGSKTESIEKLPSSKTESLEKLPSSKTVSTETLASSKNVSTETLADSKTVSAEQL